MKVILIGAVALHNPAQCRLAQILKDARLTRGLTQRELAERAGLGQSRLTLIEAGGVDFRTSTLMQLARALGLELVLAPRKVLPAVQSLIGERPRRPEAGRDSARRTPLWALRHIQQHIAALERAHPSSQELAQAKNAVQALIERGPDLGSSTLQPLRRCAAALTGWRSPGQTMRRLSLFWPKLPHN